MHNKQEEKLSLIQRLSNLNGKYLKQKHTNEMQQKGSIVGLTTWYESYDSLFVLPLCPAAPVMKQDPIMLITIWTQSQKQSLHHGAYIVIAKYVLFIIFFLEACHVLCLIISAIQLIITSLQRGLWEEVIL